MINGNVFTDPEPPVSIYVMPGHLLRGDADHLTTQMPGLRRLLRWPMVRTSELLDFLQRNVTAVQEGVGGKVWVWSCRDIRRALARAKDGRTFLQYLPDDLAAELKP